MKRFSISGLRPYSQAEQPYLQVNIINVKMDNPASPDPSKKILYIIATQALFSGFNFILANLKYRSRYALLPANASTSSNFDDMHPGHYYLNAVYEAN